MSRYIVSKEDVEALVGRVRHLHEQGLAAADALPTLASEFPHLGEGALREVVSQSWPTLDDEQRRRSVAADRTNAALKLYDALVAAGWRPPA